MKKNIKILLIFVIALFGINVNALDCSTTLRQGSYGEGVKELQTILNAKENCNLVIDGSFGSLTSNCVKSYQSHSNLEVDGIVGPKTCASLNNNVNQVIKEHPQTNVVKRVVIKENVNVRKTASTSSEIVSTVKLGKVVKILSETNNNWYKVKVNKSITGYIRGDLISKDCIIVDLSAQKLYVFKDGKKTWSTNVITGNKNTSPTPTGSYILNPNNFSKNIALQGKYPVDYWMPFILERGIGFHDASWRTSNQFTKSTYLNNGSHGCINMQHEAAEKLFNSITKTTNVVVRK